MREGKTHDQQFWDRKYDPEVERLNMMSRPSRIVNCYLRRYKKKHKCSKRDARKEFSRITNISFNDIVCIENGELPTPSQLHKIAMALSWSILFLFGIDASLYERTETMFFLEVGNRTPTMQERKAFRELYQECLLQRLEDEREERSDE